MRVLCSPSRNQRFLIASLLCVLAVGGCRKQAPSVAVKPETNADLPIVHAASLTVEQIPWPLIVRTQGSLVADEIAVVGAKVAGRVAEVPVDLGDRVAAQATLATIDQADFRLQVSQAEAQLAQARAALGLEPDAPLESLNPRRAPPVREQEAIWNEAQARSARYQELLAENAVTASDFEALVAAERVAEARHAAALNGVMEKIALIRVRAAELAVARQQLADTVILAPFDAGVQQRHVAPGTFVQVGQTLVTLVRTNPLHFRGTISERHAQQLAVGQEVSLQIESVPGKHAAQITRISPALDDLSRALLFEAEIDNRDGQLRIGLFAEAEVVLNSEHRSIAVPQAAIVEFAGTEKVWKVVDSVIGEQPVLTGNLRDGWIEILDGLALGDVILRQASEGQVARLEPQVQDDESEPRDLLVLEGSAESEDTKAAEGDQVAVPSVNHDVEPTTAAEPEAAAGP